MILYFLYSLYKDQKLSWSNYVTIVAQWLCLAAGYLLNAAQGLPFLSFHQPGLNNPHIGYWTITIHVLTGFYRSYFINYVQALNNLTKHSIILIEVRRSADGLIYFPMGRGNLSFCSGFCAIQTGI